MDAFVANGRLVHGHFGELVGNEAVYAMLDAADLEVELEPGTTTTVRTIVDELETLLGDPQFGDSQAMDVVSPHTSEGAKSSRFNLLGVLALVLAVGVAIALVVAAQIVRKDKDEPSSPRWSTIRPSSRRPHAASRSPSSARQRATRSSCASG